MATSILPSQASHTSFEPRSILSEVPDRANAGADYHSHGTKRKSPEGEGDENHVDLEDIDIDGTPITDAINMSNNAYNRFVHQSGPTKGLQSDFFMEASGYFKKREIAGIPLPTARSKKAKTESNKNGEKSDSGAKKKDSKAAANNRDFLNTELPGESTDSVPVYDTCADVRRKISAHLREPKVTQAQFRRDLHDQMHTDLKGASLSPNSLQTFRSHSGANEGGESKVFYAAYVFFEKKRVAENKPKSKKRLEMEKIWPKGVDRATFGKTRVFCLAGSSIHFDQYGRFIENGKIIT
ncbi:hypothetical protein Q7P37_005759 [Cladosporium fusiforme]